MNLTRWVRTTTLALQMYPTLEDAWSDATKILATKFMLSFSTCDVGLLSRELTSCWACSGSQSLLAWRRLPLMQFVVCRSAELGVGGVAEDYG